MVEVILPNLCRLFLCLCFYYIKAVAFPNLLFGSTVIEYCFATREMAAVLFFCLNAKQYSIMKTKTLTPIITPKRVKTKQISYKQMSELLLNLQVEFTLLADTYPEDDKSIVASNCTTSDSILFHFEDDDFSLSLDLVKKGGSL